MSRLHIALAVLMVVSCLLIDGGEAQNQRRQGREQRRDDREQRRQDRQEQRQDRQQQRQQEQQDRQQDRQSRQEERQDRQEERQGRKDERQERREQRQQQREQKQEHACNVTKALLACDPFPDITGVDDASQLLKEARRNLTDVQCKEHDDEDEDPDVCPLPDRIPVETTINGTVYNVELCESKADYLDESLGECAGEVRGLLDCGLKPLKILLRGRKGGKRGGREGGTGEPTPSPAPSEGGLDA